jgi:hydroxypyruvate isomerase
VPNAYLQYHTHCLQRMACEVAGTLQRLSTRIVHVPFADNPGRHEPGTGELNFELLFAYLDAIGHTDYVGAKYVPLQGTVAGLGWRGRAGARNSAQSTRLSSYRRHKASR